MVKREVYLLPAKHPDSSVVTEGILQAYTTAESLRMGLVSCLVSKG